MYPHIKVHYSDLDISVYPAPAPLGTVTMWSPNMKEPLVKMLCHGNAVRSIAIDSTGKLVVHRRGYQWG